MPERKIYDNITFFFCILTVGKHGTDARIQEFSWGGGGPGQSDNDFFKSSAYFTDVKWSISKKSIVFQGSRWGPIFSRGSNFFQGVSNCLFPIETHLICDFPEGVRTPAPPLWIRTWCSPHSFMVQATIHYLIWAWQTLIDRRMYHPFIVIYLIISVYYRNLRCFNR